MSNIQLANNLRHLRKKHGLTQRDLSGMLNISRQAYSNYETGKRTPDLDSLLYLCQLYQIPLDALVLRNLSDPGQPPRTLGEGLSPYLLAKEKKADAAVYLSPEELDFIIRFRSLSRESRQLIAGFLSNSSPD
ncbi:MAG TPA: helix-turn-helix transcriptional regulator [Candidatus Dorea gallistercoris]|uniref:Helix-turn-helix transcriptional regulator n=1 Tax=Candidatus Dorea gallistercoris TaxID=2838542 RepID=A0A9D1UDU4_9FIRM|nr:helix-turn-helix transcriptional regulator [Candidatus Dorea gallistercoris]